VVTLTTVGYGDKVPVTGLGKVVAGGTMLVGLALFGTFISLIGSAFVEEIRGSITRLGRDVELEPALGRCAGHQQKPREAVVTTAIREYLARVGFLGPPNGAVLVTEPGHLPCPPAGEAMGGPERRRPSRRGASKA